MILYYVGWGITWAFLLSVIVEVVFKCTKRIERFFSSSSNKIQAAVEKLQECHKAVNMFPYFASWQIFNSSEMKRAFCESMVDKSLSPDEKKQVIAAAKKT